MSTTTHLSTARPATLSGRVPHPRAGRGDPAPARPNLERQSITFTIGLYLFICTALLGTHLVASRADAAPEAPTTAVTSTTGPGATSSGRGTVQEVTP
ncbi:hypothetical protein ASE27_01835 [Oerskovia sp. Root918]|uniref:hypothetical protein n=1 Tax=unclassified Oerskovia TaxID=2619021 RepID=UPI0006F3E4B8|nr:MULTISPECIES: hypothetical protein [unclassified Oerskovia]KRC42697.1 hypothetical protein ASE15_01315 [Oerskovia sp. Root22]KRD47165.1 hypothetical protein ASE27_01835 [Oerskovia sp. Root918]